MPNDITDEEAARKAREDAAQGKSPSTQAGEFVREEMHHVREGKHGARSAQQAIAIGLSKARRAGVRLPPPGPSQGARTRRQAQRDLRKGRRSRQRISRRRSRAVSRALRREGHSAASHASLSRQGRRAARRRGSPSRHQAAMRAVRTKGHAGPRKASGKAARTRQRRHQSRRAPHPA